MDHERLTKRIKDFENKYSNGRPNGMKWRQIWNEIKAISADFKGVRFPNRQEHQDAWERFQSAVQSVKNNQSDEREQNEKKSRRSTEYKDRILSLAGAGTPPSGLEEAIFTIFTFPAQAIADITTALLPGGPIDRKKDELQYYSSKLEEGWNYFKEHKNEMFRNDKDEAFNSLKRAQDQLNAAWDQWKEGKAELFRKRNDERERKQEEYERKKREWESRTRDNIASLEERRTKLELALERRKDRRSDLDDKKYNARSDSFRSVVEGWIDENEDAIREIERKLSNVNDWIDEAYNRLSR